ncbi:MAG: hypothetical protein Q9205_007665, partial [Flavoplaca limonia]
RRNRQDQDSNTGQDIRRRGYEVRYMLDINACAAGDGFIPKVLKGAAEQELRNDAGDEPCDGYGSDGDAADGEFADREDAVVEPEDGEFEGRHGYRK